MSRRRYVSTEISTDKAINQLARKSDFAALFYTWLIPHAEDDATFDADPEELLMKVCPGRRDKEIADIQAVLGLLLEMGLIERCADMRRLRFPPKSFYKYQSYITEARRGAPEAAQDVEEIEPTAQISANQRTTAQNATSLSSSLSSSLSVKDTSANADPPPVSIEKAAAAKQQIADLWGYYKAHIQPRATVCPEVKIKARLKRFSVGQLTEAMDRFAANSWWMAKNAHQGGEWFFRSDGQIDKFLLLEPQTQREYEAEEARRNGHSSNGHTPEKPDYNLHPEWESAEAVLARQRGLPYEPN